MAILTHFRRTLYHGYGVPVLVSAGLHAIMLALLMMNWSSPPEPKIAPPLPIKASLVQAMARPEPVVDDRAIRQAQAQARERQRQAQLRKKKEAQRQLALKKKAQEAKARAEAERQRQQWEKQEKAQRAREAQKKKQAQQESEKRAREQQERAQQEAERQRQLAEQQAEAEQAQQDAADVAYYSDLLVRRMSMYWNRPPSARNSMLAVIEIRLSPFGDLQGFKIIQGSGNEAFDRSVVQAIKLGTPVMELKQLDRRIYEQYFRRFTFKFSPGDLVR